MIKVGSLNATNDVSTLRADRKCKDAGRLNSQADRTFPTMVCCDRQNAGRKELRCLAVMSNVLVDDVGLPDQDIFLSKMVRKWIYPQKTAALMVQITNRVGKPARN